MSGMNGNNIRNRLLQMPRYRDRLAQSSNARQPFSVGASAATMGPIVMLGTSAFVHNINMNVIRPAASKADLIPKTGKVRDRRLGAILTNYDLLCDQVGQT